MLKAQRMAIIRCTLIILCTDFVCLITDPKMYARCRAKADYDRNTSKVHSFDDFCSALDRKHVLMAPFCGDIPCEEKIKKLSARSVTWTHPVLMYFTSHIRTPIISPLGKGRVNMVVPKFHFRLFDKFPLKVSKH